MKATKILLLTACCIAALISLKALIGNHKIATQNGIMVFEGKGFVVLELFTSEGCSSCPPADELMAKIEQESSGKPIYILAYHVDYWDRLGWKDIFSSTDFTKRQVQYQQWLNIPSIYTPQLVVNGQSEFIGSQESRIRDAISKQLTIVPEASLLIQAHHDQDNLSLQYQATKAPKASKLLIAIIEKKAKSKVTRGENAGHELSHIQIVHKLLSEPLSSKGTVSIPLPKEFNAQNWEVLGFIQDQTNGKILAVAKADDQQLIQ